MKKKSTEHALLDIYQIETNMGAELYSCGIFKVSCIIIERRGITIRWFSSYFLGRQQTTQIGVNNI